MKDRKKTKIPKLIAAIVIIIAILMLVVGLFILNKFLKLDGNYKSMTVETTETELEDVDYAIVETTEEKIVKIYSVEETTTEDEITSLNVNVTLDKAKQIVASDLESEIKKLNFIETNREDDEGYINWVLTFSCAGKKYDYMISAYDGRILRRKEIEK